MGVGHQILAGDYTINGNIGQDTKLNIYNQNNAQINIGNNTNNLWNVNYNSGNLTF